MMKHTKRLLCLFLTFLMLIPCLYGCHGSKGLEKFVIPESFDESKTYEITFWAKNDTNKAQTNIYQKAITDFEALYPNVKVNLRLYTDYGRIYNDVITNIATQTTPNVCITYPDHIATYLTGTNIVVPLDELFSNEKYGLGGSEVKFDAPTRDEITERFLNECRFDDHYYALPFMRSTEACYINKTYVEALGYEIPDELTWDFIWEVSEAAAEKDENGVYKVNGQKVLRPFIYKSTDNMMISMLKQLDAEYSTPEGDILIFNDTTEEILFDIADHVKKEAFSTFKIDGYPANFLNAGQCIFAIDSTAGATWMGSNAPLMDIDEDNIVKFETVVRTIPQYDPDNKKMISQGPSVCVFNKADAGEVLASWLFTQFLLTNDVQIAYSQTEGYIPVTEKARNSDIYKEYLSRAGEDDKTYYKVKIDAVNLFLENLDNTFVTPVFNGSASLRDAAGQLIEHVTKSIRRKETVDEEYMTGLYEKINSLYRLDQKGNSTSSEKMDLGALPPMAVFLLCALGLVWICILSYIALNAIKKLKK